MTELGMHARWPYGLLAECTGFPSVSLLIDQCRS